ncbi:hypothetical protein [Halorussus ruber]|uniref:hypothetical protein n=1 Tax=Halorussus ruber TaxID=1126238 RepID=UPI001093333E|nr:hypothetical protein [Halorussus ruber]
MKRTEKRYGNAGVWGNSRTEPAHDLEYVGAWKSSESVEKGDATEGFAIFDSSVTLYRIPEKVSEDSQQHYQFWLWSAVRPVEQASDDEILPFTHVENRVSFDDSAYTMLAYSPSHDSSEGPVSVGPQSPGVDGLAVDFPLRQGKVRYDPDSKVGASGEYGVQWNGEVTRAQSVNATFEASWPTGAKHQFGWESRLETTKSKF